jgi:hypothetical protein
MKELNVFSLVTRCANRKRLYASIIFIMRDVLCILILWWCGHKRPRKGTARKLLDVAVPKCGPFFS